MFDQFRYRWMLAFVASIFLGLPSAAAHQWNSTDGTLRGEAKLLSVDSERATLKLPDQSVVTQPLASLSRADREFIDAALAKTDAMRALAYNQSHLLLRTIERSDEIPNGKWRSAADPSLVQFAIPADVHIPFKISPSDKHPDSDETFVYASSPSPFVFHAPTRTVCDLRNGEYLSLRKAPAQFAASAISPDGTQLAFLLTRAVGALEISVVIWDVALDAQVRTITLPTLDDNNPRFDLFDFAGAGRIVAKEFSAKHILNITLSDGLIKKLPCDGSSATDGGFVLSPGGQFLFFYPDMGESDKLLVYDLITSKPHGHLMIPPHPQGPVEKTIAHINTAIGLNQYRRARLWIDSADGMSVSPDGRYLMFFLERHYSGEAVCYDVERGAIVGHQDLGDDQNPDAITWYGENRGCVLDGKTFVDRKSCEICYERTRPPGEMYESARFVDVDKLAYVDREGLHVVRISQWEMEKRTQGYAAGATDDDADLPILTASPNPSAPKPWQVKAAAPLTVAPATVVAPPQSAKFSDNVPQPRWKEACATDSGRIVVRDRDKGVTSFDMKTGLRARYVPPELTNADVHDVSASGRYALLSLGSRYRLDVFDAATMKPYASIRTSSKLFDRKNEVVWGGLIDDQHMAAVTQGGVLTCWTIPSCHQVYSVQLPFLPTSAVLSPQRERIFISGAPSDGIAILDSASGDAIGGLRDNTLGGFEGKMAAAAFTRDGKKLSVAYEAAGDPLFSTWDLEAGLAIKHVKSELMVQRLAYSDQGDLLAIVRDGYRSNAVLFQNGSLGAPQAIQPSTSRGSSPEFVIAGRKIWYLDDGRLFPLPIPTLAAGGSR
ncbi:WD40 repeat domain-containing protein [Blastopirellula retiformator]|uniref:SLA1 homology domain-containing protein n=1 Tax=Blastopirellula retiformator TaxID=2527970 RepID=A0A5C5V509_9BACT|nr:PD40 domain-containing protein [Blastopirellula retiformator]TWT32812.1 hypothetical protein Enr8_26180 [Blastopirellula retiformator]